MYHFSNLECLIVDGLVHLFPVYYCWRLEVIELFCIEMVPFFYTLTLPYN